MEILLENLAFLVPNKCLWLKRNSKFENTIRNSNCNSNVQTHEINGNLWILDETPHQTSPTWKIHTFALKHVGWNFVPSSSKRFFFLFRNFINFVIAQTIPTFHPTWQKRDVRGNVGLVCCGLDSFLEPVKQMKTTQKLDLSFELNTMLLKSFLHLTLSLTVEWISWRNKNSSGAISREGKTKWSVYEK